MKELSEFFAENLDSDYQAFMARLIPSTALPILGVRLPLLQGLASKIIKEDVRCFLASVPPTSYENVMLKGLVIAKAPLPLEEKLRYAADFLPLIDNWGICDSFCAAFKDAKSTPPLLWEFIRKSIHSPCVYHQRFGIVMLLNYYVSPCFVDESLALIGQAASQDYYVKMACAWAFSVYYIAFPDKTLSFLEGKVSDKFILQKTVQKICESHRISKQEKAQLRKRFRG